MAKVVKSFVYTLAIVFILSAHWGTAPANAEPTDRGYFTKLIQENKPLDPCAQQDALNYIDLIELKNKRYQTSKLISKH